jgi:hypothetical protein
MLKFDKLQFELERKEREAKLERDQEMMNMMMNLIRKDNGGI